MNVGSIFYASPMLFWARTHGLFAPRRDVQDRKLSRLSVRRMKKLDARSECEWRVAEGRYKGRHNRWTPTMFELAFEACALRERAYEALVRRS